MNVYLKKINYEDIDKEYEVYEASLSKKARDKFKDNADAVSSSSAPVLYLSLL